MTLKTKITNYLRQEYPRVVHKGEIDRLAITEWGYESESAGRKCRELVKDGHIMPIYNKKHHVQYQYIQ